MLSFKQNNQNSNAVAEDWNNWKQKDEEVILQTKIC